MRSPAPSAPPSDEVALYPLSSYHYVRIRTDGFHLFPYDQDEDAHHAPSVAHLHDFFQLIWLREGAGECSCDLDRFPIENETLFLLPAGSPHAWRHERAPAGMALGFAPRFLRSSLPQPGLAARLPFLRPGNATRLRLSQAMVSDLKRLFAELRQEGDRRGEGRDDILRSLVVILLSKLRGLIEAHRGHRDLTRPLVQRFMLALEECLPRIQTVEHYAGLLGVSRTHLNDELRRCGEPTASECIHQWLLREAKRWLVHTESPAAKIAYRLHFKDPSYFGRFFRAATGLTPGDFRRQHRTDNGVMVSPSAPAGLQGRDPDGDAPDAGRSLQSTS